MAHTASLSQLQTPPWASVDGDLVPYADVRVHISAEALTRALSVFEGVKGYWDDDGEVFALRSPRRHYDRLCRSARLFHIPVEFSAEEFHERLAALARVLLRPDRDLWLRPTLHVVEGHWGEGTRASLVITAFTQDRTPAPAMRLGVSTWRRASDVELPSRVKSSANYVVARLARLEVAARGQDDAILLNQQGRVAEATGACVVALIDDTVVIPPSSEGALDSITVAAIEALCRRDGVPLVRRPLERTELLTASEVALAGTLSELTPVAEIDGCPFPTDGRLTALRGDYLRVMRGTDRLPGWQPWPAVRRAELAAAPVPAPVLVG